MLKFFLTLLTVIPLLTISCKTVVNERGASGQGQGFSNGFTPNFNGGATNVPLDPVSLAQSLETNTNLFKGPPTTNSEHPNAYNVETWYSRDLASYVGQTNFQAPIGAHAIKRFNENGQSGYFYTVMIKTGQGSTGWTYTKLTPQFQVALKDGVTPLQGTELAGCLGCHNRASNTTDYLPHFRQVTSVPGGTTGGFGGSTNVDPVTIARSLATGAPGMTKAANFGRQTQHPNAYNVETWYSDNLRSYIGQTSFQAPIGSYAIKRFNETGQSGSFYTVMIKTGQGSTGWQFTKLTPQFQVALKDGVTPLQGTELAGCLGCHTASITTDRLAQFSDLR